MMKQSRKHGICKVFMRLKHQPHDLDPHRNCEPVFRRRAVIRLKEFLPCYITCWSINSFATAGNQASWLAFLQWLKQAKMNGIIAVALKLHPCRRDTQKNRAKWYNFKNPQKYKIGGGVASLRQGHSTIASRLRLSVLPASTVQQVQFYN
jgi:hypothetical protein